MIIALHIQVKKGCIHSYINNEKDSVLFYTDAKQIGSIKA